ncbi:MAG: ribosome maturation factor RimP [Alphaproteobacteria bacterium]|nr:ribosome maturation factor RimP [Alphaproteobacteria bacterium]
MACTHHLCQGQDFKTGARFPGVFVIDRRAGADKPDWAPYIALKRCRIIESGPRGARFFITWLGVLKARSLTLQDQHLFDLINPAVEAAGFELVRVKLTGGNTKVLQIMAERSDKTMTAKDCASLSRVLSPVLEEADPIDSSYNLEVSSPGIDRPLVRAKDFEDWQGWPAKLELNRLVEGRKRFSGIVAGIDDGKVAFDIEGEDETALFPMEWIVSAKLVLTDELVAESLKAAKTNMQEQEHHDGDQS